jgi:5-methylcytosine-specific restriction endonuclease McrBC regulatory subunit McrC
MPKVWEAYVAEWVRRVWPDHSVEHGYDFPLSNRGPQLRAQADVVVWRDRKVVTLYDAKYKRAGPTPDRADIYQMVTYCERLGLDEATLVYPGQFEPRHVEVGERTIHMRGLALDMTDVEKDTEEFSSVVLNK